MCAFESLRSRSARQAWGRSTRLAESRFARSLTRRGTAHRQGRIPSRGKGKLRPVSRGSGSIHRRELSLPPHLHGIQASRRELLLVQRPCVRRALARRAHVPNHRDNSYRGCHILLDVRLAKGDFVDLRFQNRVGGIDREIRLKNQAVRARVLHHADEGLRERHLFQQGLRPFVLALRFVGIALPAPRHQQSIRTGRHRRRRSKRGDHRPARIKVGAENGPRYRHRHFPLLIVIIHVDPVSGAHVPLHGRVGVGEVQLVEKHPAAVRLNRRCRRRLLLAAHDHPRHLEARGEALCGCGRKSRDAPADRRRADSKPLIRSLNGNLRRNHRRVFRLVLVAEHASDKDRVAPGPGHAIPRRCRPGGQGVEVLAKAHQHRSLSVAHTPGRGNGRGRVRRVDVARVSRRNHPASAVRLGRNLQLHADYRQAFLKPEGKSYFSEIRIAVRAVEFPVFEVLRYKRPSRRVGAHQGQRSGLPAFPCCRQHFARQRDGTDAFFPIVREINLVIHFRVGPGGEYPLAECRRPRQLFLRVANIRLHVLDSHGPGSARPEAQHAGGGVRDALDGILLREKVVPLLALRHLRVNQHAPRRGNRLRAHLAIVHLPRVPLSPDAAFPMQDARQDHRRRSRGRVRRALAADQQIREAFKPAGNFPAILAPLLTDLEARELHVRLCNRSPVLIQHGQCRARVVRHVNLQLREPRLVVSEARFEKPMPDPVSQRALEGDVCIFRRERHPVLRDARLIEGVSAVGDLEIAHD